MEGVYFAKWRGSQSGGGLKVVGVYFEVEGVYYAKWRGCILKWRGSQSGGGVF